MAQKVLAITISSDWIKIVEEMSTQRGIQVFHATTIATPEDCVEDGQILNATELAGTIEAELLKNEMVSKNVIFSMISSKIANKEVMTPALREPKLSSFIHTNANEYFPVNLDDYLLSYSVLETIETEEGKKNRTMVAAAPAAMVESYYELAKTLGLTVTSLDYAANSNLQLVRHQIDERPSIVIQVGEDNTIVSILANNMLRLMRTVPYGVSTIVSALMEKKDGEDFTQEDAYKMLTEQTILQPSFESGEYVTDSLRYMVNNISRVMDYYLSKNPNEQIEHAYIISEGPAILGMAELLHNELNGLDIQPITSFKQVVLDGSNLDFTTASLYLTNIGSAIAPVNFIPTSSLEAQKKAGTFKYFRLLLYVAVVASAALIAVPLLNYYSLKNTNEAVKRNINSLHWVEEIIDAYYDAQAVLDDAKQFADKTKNEDDELLELIEYLEENMPSDISINAFAVSNGNVTISCTGNSKRTLAQFLQILISQPNIEDVDTNSMSEGINSDGVTTEGYTISFRFTSFKALETEAAAKEVE